MYNEWRNGLFFAIYTRLQGYKIVVYNFQDYFKRVFSIFNHWQWLWALTCIIDHLLLLRSFLADEQIFDSEFFIIAQKLWNVHE